MISVKDLLACGFAAAMMLPGAMSRPAHAAAADAAGSASVNAGRNEPDASLPFQRKPVATFSRPWAIAFLPDGRLLVTEKGGRIFVVTQDGQKTPVSGVPKVYDHGQNGLLDIVPSPRFADDRQVFFTYVEPEQGGGALALARAVLDENAGKARLSGLKTLWRQEDPVTGGQPGGIIAFSPDGKHLFLSVGDRMQPQTAQDPDQARGKVLRLNPDGSTPADNPMAARGGVRAQTWSTGHRNPYGLAFDAAGRLWSDEMGPRGGDELNLIQPGKNYGWPLVSNGDNYNGTPIPRHATRPEFQAPPLYWTPVISPAGLAFYSADLFPDWKGSALIGGLSADALLRVTFGKDGRASEANRWSLGHRIRDVAVAPDGAVWIIEDGQDGRLLRLTPAK